VIEAELFEKNDIVRLSETGRRKFRHPDRLGRVLGVSSSGSQVTVQWDGLRTCYLIHERYLERSDEEQMRETVGSRATGSDKTCSHIM
jgi:hypothetical protein